MEIRFAQTQKPDYQIQYSRIFRKNDDTTYIVIEKAIFYSAFIIRKLIDCDGNLSDEAENYLKQRTDKKTTDYRKVLCAFDYMKYKDETDEMIQS